jgi:hypothetical protein
LVPVTWIMVMDPPPSAPFVLGGDAGAPARANEG